MKETERPGWIRQDEEDRKDEENRKDEEDRMTRMKKVRRQKGWRRQEDQDEEGRRIARKREQAELVKKDKDNEGKEDESGRKNWQKNRKIEQGTEGKIKRTQRMEKRTDITDETRKR